MRGTQRGTRRSTIIHPSGTVPGCFVHGLMLTSSKPNHPTTNGDRTAYLEGAIASTTASATPQEQVDSLIQARKRWKEQRKEGQKDMA